MQYLPPLRPTQTRPEPHEQPDEADDAALRLLGDEVVMEACAGGGIDFAIGFAGAVFGAADFVHALAVPKSVSSAQTGLPFTCTCTYSERLAISAYSVPLDMPEPDGCFCCPRAGIEAYVGPVLIAQSDAANVIGGTSRRINRKKNRMTAPRGLTFELSGVRRQALGANVQ